MNHVEIQLCNWRHIRVCFDLQVRVRQAIADLCFKEAAAAANHMFAVCHAAMLQVSGCKRCLATHRATFAGSLQHRRNPVGLSMLQHIRLCTPA
jgi:hypothetical protein